MAATLILLAARYVDHPQVLVTVLSLSLMIAWLALVALVIVLVKAKHGEARSKERVRRFANAVHQTADAVFITDRSGTIEYVNPAFEGTTGYSSDEVIGQTPRILKSGEQGPEYYKRLWETVLGGKSFHGTPINRKRNGDLYHAEQTITPMYSGNGEITHFVSVMRDMTDRKLIERQEIEMGLGASIQRKLLPEHPPRSDGYDVAGAVLPALATCGDYYDFINTRDDGLCLAVADACGHGVGPALIAVQVRAHLRSLVQTDLELNQILFEINQILVSDLDDDLFVTMAVVCVDATTGSLRWANAGHPTAYVFDTTGSVKTELRSTGLPLGMLPGRPYTLGQGVTIQPGDVVLMITDGFLEALNADGAEFGTDRVLEVMNASVQLSAKEIVQRLHDAVREFADGHPQDDDLTAVVFKRIDRENPDSTPGAGPATA